MQNPDNNDDELDSEVLASDTILIAEDDAALSHLIRKNLKRAGLQVKVVLWGAEAITQVVNHPPSLLLLDYRLPDMTGQQVIESLAERQCTVPFIITTGYGDERVAVEMMKLGARDYLVKDANFLELLPTVVQRVLEQLATEKKLVEAEHHLRESEEKYRSLFEHANDSIFISDVSTRRILDANENAARRLGYSRAELLQLKIDDINSPAVVVRNDTIAQELVAKGHIIFEHTHRRKDGSEIPVEISSRVANLGGRRVFQSLVRDITERKRIEQKLKARARQQAAVAKLGQQALAGTELSQLMTEAVGLVADTLEVEYSKVLELLSGGDQMLLRTGVGWSEGLVGQALVDTGTDSQAGYTLLSKTPVIVEDLRTESRFRGPALLRDHKVVSGLSVIIAGPSQPFGVLGAHTTRRQVFTEDDVHFLQTVANVLAAALERARAEDEIRHRNRELALLNQVIAASAATLEPELILKTACRELVVAFDVPHATASLLNDNRTALVVVAEYRTESGIGSSKKPIPVADNPLIQRLLTHKSPVVVDDAQNDSRSDSIQELVDQNSLVSLLLVPLVIGDEVIGSLSLDSSRPRFFSYGDVNLAWRVADQIAGALTRTRLTQTQRLLGTALDQAGESIIITDAEGTIVYVNPAFEQVTGYNRAEVIGQNPRFLNSGKHDDTFYKNMWATITAGQVWHGHFSNKKKDGTLFIEDATISPVRNESGNITNYVAVKRDVTRELELEERYHQAQKMEAVGRLTGGIAHDFNNLLTGINGFAELIQMRLSPDSPYVDMVASIQRSGQRAADLVRQLLAFSRKQIIEPQVLDLNKAVTEMEKMLQPIIGEDIELKTILAPGLWSIKADLSQIEQVVVNLAVNARDAMPNGGQLIIETGNVMLAEKDATEHLGVDPGDYILLAVSDSGDGISAEVKAHIFEPFYTTKERGKGTGLGLATIYGIVRQNDGGIWVDSEEGEGTTFKIYWPRAKTVSSSLIEHFQAEELLGGTETILLAEDEAIVREITVSILREQGYTVLEAANGQEALALAQEHYEKIQLLLTDVVMPQMSGKDLASRLKMMCPNLKVLYTSGYMDETIAQHGVLDSHIALIQKPFTATELAHKVREILDA